MAENVQETVTPAASLSEFRARKDAGTTASTTSPVEKQASAVSQDGNAEASAPSTQETQEKPRKKAQTAEERAAELRAAGRVKEAEKILADDAEKKEYEAWKASKADREREAEELRQLRAARQAPPPSPAASPAEAKPAAPAVPADRPKLKDFLAMKENEGKPYDEVVEQWKDADDEWRDRKREAKSAEAKQIETVNTKLAAARAKYADFDNALSTVVATSQNLHTLVTEFDNGLDVVYHLHSDPVERQRILALSPARQLAELGMLAARLTSNGTTQPKPPEKPPTPPPVSRTPPPPRSLSGISPSEAPQGTPKSLSEFRRNRAAARAS